MRLRILPLPLVLFALPIVATGAPAAPGPGVGETDTGAQARALFERLLGLEGEWVASSTAGWETVTRFEVAARGSVVMSTTYFDEGATMHTLYHLDGDRLMLTHYCEAGNQPRLVATDYQNGGRAVTFTFLDATNLPSRDHGHMDKAIYRFLGESSFSSRWTWYQDGEETWMEEIVYRRKSPGRAPSVSEPTGEGPDER